MSMKISERLLASQ